MLAHDQMPIEAQAKALSGSLTGVTEHKPSQEFVRSIQVSVASGTRGTILLLMLVVGLAHPSALRARRGHRYVTNVLDCDGAGLLFMIEGRSSEALGCFAQALREHGGDPAQSQAIAMDMSPAYLKGAAEHFP